MKSVKLFFTSLVVLLAAVTGYAQDIQVKGVVSDATTGETIPFASIQVKGTTKVVTTDLDGAYTITVPADATLIVSFVGYANAEVPVNGRSIVNIAMEQDSEQLDDVLVVAYGTVSKEAKTGSVTTVRTESIGDAPVASVEKMLAGKMAGVQISSYSGQPGAPTTVRIRGISSIGAGSDPLWVVDGVPIMTNDQNVMSNVGAGSGTTMSSINPNDIESITVLKDAAAASIYGSRAANGVILVTTKSGKQGKASFTARAKVGVTQLSNDKNFRPATPEQTINFHRDMLTNAGYNPDELRPLSMLDLEMTDWMDHFTRIGRMQEYEVNAMGGNDKGTFYTSLAYHDETGIYYGVDYKRFTARINADYKLLKNLKAGVSVNAGYSDQNSGQMGRLFYSNGAYAMWNLLPWEKPYDEDGNHNVDLPNNSDTNPRANAEYDEYNDKSYRFQGQMFLEYKPIKQITIKTNNSAEMSLVNSRQYWAPETNQGETTLWMYRSEEYRLLTSNTVSYDDIFADKHSVRVMVGQEAQYDGYNYLGGKSPQVDPAIPYPNTGSAATDEVYYGESEETLLSFFGTADYNYESKYYAQASVRYDGSSLFGADTKWGLFWSASASWNLHNENWLKSVDWLNTLKVRASYGVNGNNNIGRYRAYGLYATSPYNGITGMLPSSSANPKLSWEKNKTWNVGIDFAFFDRFNGSIDFYKRNTEDMLLNKQIPQTSGFSSNLMNIGAIENKGVEIMLEGDIMRTEDITWTAGFNISFNRSKVVDLADSEFLTATDPRSTESSPVRIVPGKSMYTFYVRDWYGVNPSNGEGLFYAEDGSLTNDRNKARYIYAGSPEPKALGGFNTQFSWKGLSLSAFFEYTIGNKVMNTNIYGWYDDDINVPVNNLALDYWKKPGDNATYPKPVYGSSSVYYAGYSTRFIQDGSYLRIKDVTLSYTLPQNITKKAGMNNVKVYVSAINPYTFHDVDGVFDPELGSLGYDYGGGYSMVKSFIGGLEITF
ncbi:MAG: TonB-dependent receptor [Bacteroidales bacterium]|nr:TonB-dependent receptor [Bacteroidales bacterium]